jgi:hypothetical protein
MASDKRDPSASDAEIQRRVRGRAEAIRKAKEFARRRAEARAKALEEGTACPLQASAKED